MLKPSESALICMFDSKCVCEHQFKLDGALSRKINKEVEGSKHKASGGIWGYIAGTPAI